MGTDAFIIGVAMCVLGCAVATVTAQAFGPPTGKVPPVTAPAAKPHATVPPKGLNSYDEIQRKMQAPRPDLKAVRSPELQVALNNPERLIAFIAAPQTPYLERRAAAVQGAEVISTNQMPAVVAALDAFDAEERQHNWGLQYHPMSAMSRLDEMPKAFNHNRMVFGHPWTLPDHRLDFPITWEEESKAPWPWQAEQAMQDLFQMMQPAIDDPAGLHRWFDVAMTMPCTDDAQAVRFFRATTAVSDFKTPAVMARWRRIAENPAMPEAAGLIAQDVGQAVRTWNDDRARALGQLIVLAELKRPEPDTRLSAAGSLQEMRRQLNFNEVEKWAPATSILALGEMALNPKMGDDWSRLYSYAFVVCELVDDPPFRPDRSMNPESPLVQQQLKQFRGWFVKARPGLTALAEVGKAELERIRKESDEAAAAFSPVGKS